jgi:hypothetical protein
MANPSVIDGCDDSPERASASDNAVASDVVIANVSAAMPTESEIEKTAKILKFMDLHSVRPYYENAAKAFRSRQESANHPCNGETIAKLTEVVAELRNMDNEANRAMAEAYGELHKASVSG